MTLINFIAVLTIFLGVTTYAAHFLVRRGFLG